MSTTSTTWKSLTWGFAAGVVSTGLVALGLPYAWLLWIASVAYIAYRKFDG